MMDRTLNVSLGLSVGLHGGLLGFYIYLVAMAPKTSTTVISDVDLLIPIKPQAPIPVPAGRPEPPSTWNFLKMALPQIPVARQMEVKIPEARREIKIPDRLEEKMGKLESRSDLQMSLSKKSLALAEAAAKDLTARNTQVPMAASLQLEEVGSRRAPTLPPDLTLENAGLPAFKPQNIQDVKAFVAQQRTRPVGATPLQPEASGEAKSGKSSGLGKFAEMFSAPSLQLQGGGPAGPIGAPRPKIEPNLPPTLPKRQEVLGENSPSKAVEIVGPLSQRKVLRAYVPPYPKWAKDQGILEAAVSVRFFVSRDGKVLPNMRVEKSSGYGILDRLVMEALKKWVFAPSESEKEWGVITFRFVLE
ncbi:MAG: energy transducer TonB [Elusimicrobia bacterium]|nr:energy transducer TonB [Elusimicrobiota bacterium]